MASAIDAAEAELPEQIQRGLSAAVKYMVSRFLNAPEYGKISSSLSTKWDRFQSLSAATKLMEQHGVKLTPEEEQRFAGFGEMQMIDALVNKMPQQSKEQFQHFFLQLQLIVSTATRIRQALEEGRADLVESAMDDAESTGITPYILKMAITQAGSEVSRLKEMHEGFVKDAEQKMSRLIRGQEDAMQAKKKLAKAQAQLMEFHTSANDHIKKVLMTFTSGSSGAMLTAVWKTWVSYTKKLKQENMIYNDYRERIELAEKRLIEAKASQLSGVRKMLAKKAAAFENTLLAEVFALFKEEREEAIFQRESADKVRALEAKLAQQSEKQKDGAKQVMLRMGSASEAGLVGMCWQSWIAFCLDYRRDKETNDKVKEAEKRMAEYRKGKSKNTQGILNRMSQASATGLVYEVWQAWMNHYLDEKKSNEMAEVLNGANSKLSAFGNRNSKSAKNVMERATEHSNAMVMLRALNAWRLDVRLETLMKKNQVRIDAKRQQLLGVQSMFRNFAIQLEAGIKSGADTDRDLKLGPPRDFEKHRGMRKQMTKTENTVSLPDIHAKPSHRAHQSRENSHRSGYARH